MTLLSSPAYASVSEKEPVTVPAPPPGKAEVVFFRPSTFEGSAISCAVSENGTKVSSLPPARFFIVVADAGRHTYSVASEASDSIFLNLSPGQIAYAKCHVSLGIFAGRPKLDVAQEEEFTSKTWKSVDPSRIGPNVLTDEQIRAAPTMMPGSVAAYAAPAAPPPDIIQIVQHTAEVMPRPYTLNDGTTIDSFAASGNTLVLITRLSTGAPAWGDTAKAALVKAICSNRALYPIAGQGGTIVATIASGGKSVGAVTLTRRECGL